MESSNNHNKWTTLVSGGIVYVNVSQGGNQLSINDNAPIQASVPSNNYIAMDYFTGRKTMMVGSDGS